MAFGRVFIQQHPGFDWFVLFVRFIVLCSVAFVGWIYAALGFKLNCRPSFEDLDSQN